MAHTCSECTFLDLNKEYSSSDGRFWCEYDHEWHYSNEAECWKYCTAYSRSDSVARSYNEYSGRMQHDKNNSCYITTVVCNILNKSDNTLDTLRKFRKEFLQTQKEYHKILVEYDVVGPIIAKKLMNDASKEQIALNLYNMGISEVINLINDKKELEAIKKYQLMTNLLIAGYKINTKVTSTDIENADIINSGHGRYVKK